MASRKLIATACLSVLLLSTVCFVHGHEFDFPEGEMATEASQPFVNTITTWLSGLFSNEHDSEETIEGASAEPFEGIDSLQDFNTGNLGRRPAHHKDGQLAGALASSVGNALEEYYATSPPALEDSSSASLATCADAIGNDTQLLISLLVTRVDKICENGTDFESFCYFHEDFKNLTAIALLSKLKINPISIALTRLAADGPCSVDSADSEDLQAAVHKLKKVSKSASKDASWKQALASAPNDIEDCKACVKCGLKLYAKAVVAKIEFVCANTQCPKIKAACAFASAHHYLTQVALLLKLKPWEKVTKSCLRLGACRMPSPDATYAMPDDPTFLPSVSPFVKGDHHDHFAPEEGSEPFQGGVSSASSYFPASEDPVTVSSLPQTPRSLWASLTSKLVGRQENPEPFPEDQASAEDAALAEMVSARDESLKRERVLPRRMTRQVAHRGGVSLAARFGNGEASALPAGTTRGPQLAGFRLHSHRGGEWGHKKEVMEEMVQRWRERKGSRGEAGGEPQGGLHHRRRALGRDTRGLRERVWREGRKGKDFRRGHAHGRHEGHRHGGRGKDEKDGKQEGEGVGTVEGEGEDFLVRPARALLGHRHHWEEEREGGEGKEKHHHHKHHGEEDGEDKEGDEEEKHEEHHHKHHHKHEEDREDKEGDGEEKHEKPHHKHHHKHEEDPEEGGDEVQAGRLSSFLASEELLNAFVRSAEPHAVVMDDPVEVSFDGVAMVEVGGSGEGETEAVEVDGESGEGRADTEEDDEEEEHVHSHGHHRHHGGWRFGVSSSLKFEDPMAAEHVTWVGAELDSADPLSEILLLDEPQAASLAAVDLPAFVDKTEAVEVAPQWENVEDNVQVKAVKYEN